MEKTKRNGDSVGQVFTQTITISIAGLFMHIHQDVLVSEV